MKKYTMEEACEICRVSRPTIFKRKTRLKIKTRYLHVEGKTGRPQLCFTLSEINRINAYRKPGKYDSWRNLTELGEYMDCSAAEASEYARKSGHIGQKVRSYGILNLRFSPYQVSQIKKYMLSKKDDIDTTGQAKSAKGPQGISKNRIKGFYMTIHPLEMVNCFQGGRE